MVTGLSGILLYRYGHCCQNTVRRSKYLDNLYLSLSILFSLKINVFSSIISDKNKHNMNQINCYFHIILKISGMTFSTANHIFTYVSYYIDITLLFFCCTTWTLYINKTKISVFRKVVYYKMKTRQSEGQLNPLPHAVDMTEEYTSSWPWN